MPSYVVKNAPADWSRKRKKWEKTKCQQKVCFLLGKETGGGGGFRNTRWDSSYDDTANALIEASKKSAIDLTGREIIGI